MPRRLPAGSLAGVAILVSCVSGLSLAEPIYTVVDLGTLGGISSQGRAIDDDGRVVGNSKNASGMDRAFRTNPGSPIDPTTDNLGTLDGTYAFAEGLNAYGQVAGYAGASNDQVYHAFLTRPNQPINRLTDDLGTLSGRVKSYSQANAVNDSGVAVGYSDTGGTAWVGHAFRTQPNSPISPATDDLGTLGGSFSAANDINNAGQVVGYSDLAGDAVYHAFRTSPNQPINTATDDLGTLGGGRSVARAINEAGWIVGSSQIAGSQTWHAFKLPPNTVLSAADDIGTLAGDAHAIDLNSAGVVVGTSWLDGVTKHAFVYDELSGMRDLNGLIEPCQGWTLIEARGINHLGEITGHGTLGGEMHAFLLRPAAPRRRPGDFDWDCDVDWQDFELFQACAGGPGVSLSAGCQMMDLDSDGDADGSDFGTWQRCFSGEGTAADLDCAG